MSYEDLLAEGRLERRSFTLQDVETQMALAQRDIGTARELAEGNLDWAYAIAYNALLQAARGLIFARGYRPVGPHQHLTAIQCLRAEGLEDQLLLKVDRMRRRRHRVVYEQLGVVSRADAESALATAQEVVGLIESYLLGPGGDPEGANRAGAGC